MKGPQDLCHVDDVVYRRQMQRIHRLARQKNLRPSEFLRAVLDDMLIVSTSERFEIMSSRQAFEALAICTAVLGGAARIGDVVYIIHRTAARGSMIALGRNSACGISLQPTGDEDRA
jgi:hypothetical protein